MSNSQSQREYIEAQARSRGLGNLDIITCDMNRFATDDYWRTKLPDFSKIDFKAEPAASTAASPDAWLSPEHIAIKDFYTREDLAGLEDIDVLVHDDQLGRRGQQAGWPTEIL